MWPDDLTQKGRRPGPIHPLSCGFRTRPDRLGPARWAFESHLLRPRLAERDDGGRGRRTRPSLRWATATTTRATVKDR
jgi:hypothetical protein